MRADQAKRLATSIMYKAGTHAPGSLELIVSELCKLSHGPDFHQLVVLELIAAGGFSAPGTFDEVLATLRGRYPSEKELDDFIGRMKRRVSLKSGKPVPHVPRTR